MILYLDTSALVKKYIAESGSDVVNQAISDAELVGLSTMGRAEVAAAFAKAVRMSAITREEGLVALQLFRSEWSSMMHIQTSEMVVARADFMAWEYHLRGYDAVHLASAVLWQESLGRPLTMAVFDQKLWTVAEQIGLTPLPADLDAFMG
jgi:predicted nucleic acid-binding protein